MAQERRHRVCRIAEQGDAAVAGPIGQGGAGVDRPFEQRATAGCGNHRLHLVAPTGEGLGQIFGGGGEGPPLVGPAGLPREEHHVEQAPTAHRIARDHPARADVDAGPVRQGLQRVVDWHERPPRDMAGELRRHRLEQRAHHRFQAVGADHDIAVNAPPVVEHCRRSVNALDRRIRHQRHASPFGRFNQNGMKIGSVDRDVGRAVLRARAGSLDRHQHAPILPMLDTLPARLDPCARNRLAHPDVIQSLHRVGRQCDAGTDVAERGGCFEQAHREADLGQRDRRSHPADAATDDRDAFGPRHLSGARPPEATELGGFI